MSMKTSKLWSFIIKCFTRLLLLADTCKTRYPTLYKDLNCSSCNDPSVVEDWNHIFEYSKLQDIWKHIESNSIAVMITAVKKILKDPDTPEESNRQAAEMAEQIALYIWSQPNCQDL